MISADHWEYFWKLIYQLCSQVNTLFFFSLHKYNGKVTYVHSPCTNWSDSLAICITLIWSAASSALLLKTHSQERIGLALWVKLSRMHFKKSPSWGKMVSVAVRVPSTSVSYASGSLCWYLNIGLKVGFRPCSWSRLTMKCSFSKQSHPLQPHVMTLTYLIACTMPLNPYTTHRVPKVCLPP